MTKMPDTVSAVLAMTTNGKIFFADTTPGSCYFQVLFIMTSDHKISLYEILCINKRKRRNNHMMLLVFEFVKTNTFEL